MKHFTFKPFIMHYFPNQNNPALKNLLRVKSVAIAIIMLCGLLLGNLSASAQSTVRGKVTSDSGAPIDGATVSVKGTSNATVTDNKGDFSLTASKDAVLVITYVGYGAKEVRVGNNTNLNITLSLSDKDLGEVVVIGYGTQKKKDVTGSTVTVKGETLNEVKAPNIFNQLQGRAPGVDIVSNSAQIGASGQIRIRGNRSITGNNNPLVVVDGMVYGGNINDINPEYISSVDILKDASATAIYGSRGSNGVIIISTKRGSSRKPITTYNGYVGVVKPIVTYRLFNGTEYSKFKADAATGNSNTPNSNLYALTPIEQTNLAAGVNTDWQDLLLTTGIRTSHDVSVRGGSDRTQYFFGLGYYKETGIITDQNLDRYSFSVNVDHRLSERIKVGFTSFNVFSPSNRIGTNAYGSATRLGPLYKPYNADGTINFQPAIQQGVDFNQINPLTSIGNDDLIKAYQRRSQIQDNFYGELKITNDLKYKLTFGFGWSQSFNSNHRA
jgi:TonB-linked SusC/RagA family outer membrane protein